MALAGTVAVIWVLETTTTLVAATPPTVTPVAPLKLIPVMVTLRVVPTAVWAGLTEVTPGLGMEVVTDRLLISWYSVSDPLEPAKPNLKVVGM